jgi:predicted lipoprotein with Yx(FWY)xxD motif
MKRTLIGVVIVILVAVGAYAIFHTSDNNTKTTTSSSTKSNQPAVNNAVVVTKTQSGIGQYLTDPAGNTLYTYNADTAGVSNCTGSCLTNWPAYQDKGSTSNLPANVGTIKRADNGQTQYTYKGLPLYYFASDTKGQVTGNNVENFTVAKPVAASSSSSSSNSNTGTSSGSSSGGNSSSGYPY